MWGKRRCDILLRAKDRQPISVKRAGPDHMIWQFLQYEPMLTHERPSSGSMGVSRASKFAVQAEAPYSSLKRRYKES